MREKRERERESKREKKERERERERERGGGGGGGQTNSKLLRRSNSALSCITYSVFGGRWKIQVIHIVNIPYNLTIIIFFSKTQNKLYLR